MPEHFSHIYLSGDLGQALALREGEALIFDGMNVNDASTAEINLFFDSAMDLIPIEAEQRAALDTEGLTALVLRETAKADALRFLLFGMDSNLSDELRLSAIELASSMLENIETAEHVQGRFLISADPNSWDSRSAAVLATLIEADLPALLYLAASEPEQLESLRTIEPRHWPGLPARTQVAQSLSSDRSKAERPPVWELAAQYLDRPVPGRRARPSAADWFVERFGAIELPSMRAQVGRAMIYSGAIRYREKGDASSALQILENAIGRMRGLRGDALQAVVSMAMVCKAEILARLGRLAEAAEINAEAAGLVAKGAGQAARGWAGRARFALAGNLKELGREREAVLEYAGLLADLGTVPSPELRTLTAQARYNLGVALLGLGRTREARDCFLETAKGLDSADERSLQGLRAKALYNAAWASAALDDATAARRLYRGAIDACSAVSDDRVASLLTKSLYNLGTVLARMGKHEEAVAAYDQVIGAARIGGDDHLLAAQAMFNRAISLEAMSNLPAADAAYQSVVARFGRAAETVRIVAKAHVRRVALARRVARGVETGQEAAPEAESYFDVWLHDMGDEDI